MTDVFYNTTNEEGDSLKLCVDVAKFQETEILNLYRARGASSPSEIYHLLGGRYPITSIRRAITNLTKKDKLQKLEAKCMGMYGRREYIWGLK